MFMSIFHSAIQFISSAKRENNTAILQDVQPHIFCCFMNTVFILPSACHDHTKQTVAE